MQPALCDVAIADAYPWDTPLMGRHESARPRILLLDLPSGASCISLKWARYYAHGILNNNY